MCRTNAVTMELFSYTANVQHMSSANTPPETTVSPIKARTRERKSLRSLPSLQPRTAASEMTQGSIATQVDTAPIEWESLPNHAMFSTSPDGSFPQLKASRSKKVDLRTLKSDWVGSGRVYRIYL
jgi:hypothetical protein